MEGHSSGEAEGTGTAGAGRRGRNGAWTVDDEGGPGPRQAGGGTHPIGHEPGRLAGLTY